MCCNCASRYDPRLCVTRSACLVPHTFKRLLGDTRSASTCDEARRARRIHASQVSRFVWKMSGARIGSKCVQQRHRENAPSTSTNSSNAGTRCVKQVWRKLVRVARSDASSVMHSRSSIVNASSRLQTLARLREHKARCRRRARRQAQPMRRHRLSAASASRHRQRAQFAHVRVRCAGPAVEACCPLHGRPLSRRLRRHVGPYRLTPRLRVILATRIFISPYAKTARLRDQRSEQCSDSARADTSQTAAKRAAKLSRRARRKNSDLRSSKRIEPTAPRLLQRAENCSTRVPQRPPASWRTAVVPRELPQRTAADTRVIARARVLRVMSSGKPSAAAPPLSIEIGDAEQQRVERVIAPVVGNQSAVNAGTTYAPIIPPQSPANIKAYARFAVQPTSKRRAV